MGRFSQGNWGIKILSLALAVVLWIYVSNEKNPTKGQVFKDIPIETRGVGPNLAVSQLPGSASVRVQANQEVLANLSPRSIEVFVDLGGVKPGRATVPVQVRVPEGVKVTDLRPREVQVQLETLVEKQVPVSVRSNGSPGEGYRVLDIKTKPDQIVLRGSKSILERVEAAYIDVLLKGKNRSFGETVPVIVSDDRGNFLEERLVKRIPPVVDILVSIVPDRPTKQVQVVPQITGQPAVGYVVTMSEVEPPELIITGNQEVLDGISRVSTRPVDINGAKEDVYMDIEPQLPEGVIANRRSLKILVKIERK